MSDHPLDQATVTKNLFYPRKTAPHASSDEMVKDGTVRISADIEIGYRLYINHSSAPILLYFHGNGEIASDYDNIAPFYHAAGLSLLVVDYRGYGWSTGVPLTTQLLPDAQIVFNNIDKILRSNGIVPHRQLFLMGRSLGSAPAIYLAMNKAGKLSGLIIESGYADAPSLFGRLGIRIPDNLKDDVTLPIGNGDKIKEITIPTLVIHGEIDTLIPAYHGQTLYDNVNTPHKTLVMIPNAGHNNVSFVDIRRYFDEITQFIDIYSR